MPIFFGSSFHSLDFERTSDIARCASCTAAYQRRFGYGAGTRDLHDRPNMLRIFVGTADVPADSDIVCLLETNLDDVSPEVIGFAKQKLLTAGAHDVYSTSIQMKKDRPGTLLSVLCDPALRERLEATEHSAQEVSR